MLKEYLHTAKEDLEAKKEILDIKQQRLTIAQDEFHLLRHAYTGLDTSRTSCKYSEFWINLFLTLMKYNF